MSDARFDPKAYAKAIMKGEIVELRRIANDHPGCLQIELHSGHHGENYREFTPAQLAAFSGQKESLGFFLDRGVPVSTVGLYIPIEKGHVEIVSYLLTQGAQPTEGHLAEARKTRQCTIANILETHLRRKKGEEDVLKKMNEEYQNQEKWTLSGPEEIIHEKTVSRWRLTDIFNFEIRERIKIMKNIDDGNEDIKHFGFDELRDKTVLEIALEKLLRAGGKADPQSVHGPVQPRKLKSLRDLS